MAKKKGLITGKPTTHNPHDLVRVKKLKRVVRQARKIEQQFERKAAQLKKECDRILKELDTGWEAEL